MYFFINNSKFYKITLPIGLGMAISVYLLNKLFYFDLNFGTEGLALSTLLSILVFNSIKLWFVKAKLKMTPYTRQSITITIVIMMFFGLFYFWDFSIPEFFLGRIPVHIILNIIIKSIIITVLYLLVVLKLKVSNQINSLAIRFKKKLF